MTAAIILLTLPSVVNAQSDLKKIGNFLQGLQQLQQQQNRPKPQPQNGQQNPVQAPYGGGDPNMSGNQNRGDFNRDGFFPGPQTTYPQNYQPQNVRPQYRPNGIPQNNYPQYQPSQSQQITPVPQRSYSNQPIVISCDGLSGGLCDYKLITASNRAYSYQIKSGQTQRLKENTDWALMYKPTSANTWKTYNLRGGRSYEFRHESGRWQLYMLQ